MALGHAHPTDVLVDELTSVYAANHARLETIVRAGLARGLDPSRIGTPGVRVGDATLAYRQRQLQQAQGILAELDQQAGRLAPLVVGRSYGAGLVAVDTVLGTGAPAGAAARFGRIHARAVEELVGQLSGSLRAAHERTGRNIADVFRLADELDGPLPTAGRVGGARFLGRRFDDQYRRLSLETVAGGVIGLDTRRQVSENLARTLVTEGVTTATAGFVDRRGRRWSLETYASMVARTTTREAATGATVGRLGEHGLDLATITAHPHLADECSPYDGRTFSLTGATSGYPVLRVRPPFHPNCRHVLGPANVDLDAFEAELERAVSSGPAVAEPPAPRLPRGRAGAPPTPPTPPDPVAEAAAGPRADVPNLLDAPTPPDPPFGPYTPDAGPQTAQRLESSRIRRLIDGDPGPEDGARDAWLASLEEGSVERRLAEQADAGAARLLGTVTPQWAGKLALTADELAGAGITNAAELRVARRALKDTLGDDAYAYLKRKWAVDAGIEEDLLTGRMTIAEAEDAAANHYAETEAAKAARAHEEQAARDGYKRGAYPCDHCGRLKSRPSDPCDYCGTDPVEGVDYNLGSTDESALMREARRRYDENAGYLPDYSVDHGEQLRQNRREQRRGG